MTDSPEQSNNDKTRLNGKADRTFRDLLESAPDAFVIVDQKGKIVLINSQTERLFGYQRNELLGKTMEILVPERFRGQHVGHRQHYTDTPKVRPMGVGLELYGLRKDGSEFPVEISLSPIETEEGTLISSAIRDITDRKRVEQELQKKNAELEAANEELKAFSYSVSHDLRAPLRAMHGFASILESQLAGQTSVEVKHALKRIKDNAARMSELIDRLLDFSSLNWLPVTKVKMSPANIVQAVWDELRGEVKDRRVEIEIGRLPPCEADPTLLKQVFVNLMSNALKYSRGSNPAIIKVGARKEEGKTVYYVQDNGVGFNMEYAGKLFRVFQRLHGIEEFEGTGVGLAIVQRIVQRHGGRVWVEAEENRGATFYFTLGDNQSPESMPV